MSNVETRIHLKNGPSFVMDGLVDQSIDDAIRGISKAKMTNGTVNFYDLDGTEPEKASNVSSIEVVFKD